MPRPFTRVRLAAAYPGKCFRCGHNEDLVDLGGEPINGYGDVHLCTRCIAEMVEQMGYIEKATSDRRVAAKDEEIDHLARELAARPTLTDPRYEGLSRELADLAARHPGGPAAVRPAVPDVAPGELDAPAGDVAVDDAAAEPVGAVDDAGDADGGDAEGADGALGEDAGSDGGDAGSDDAWSLLGR